jgi:hypothetical protein
MMSCSSLSTPLDIAATSLSVDNYCFTEVSTKVGPWRNALCPESLGGLAGECGDEVEVLVEV